MSKALIGLVCEVNQDGLHPYVDCLAHHGKTVYCLLSSVYCQLTVNPSLQ